MEIVEKKKVIHIHGNVEQFMFFSDIACIYELGLLAPKTFRNFWFSNLSTLSIPDEGSSKSASCALN